MAEFNRSASGDIPIFTDFLLVLYSDTRVGRQPDIQATPCPRWLSGSTPDRSPRASHTVVTKSTLNVRAS